MIKVDIHDRSFEQPVSSKPCPEQKRGLFILPLADVPLTDELHIDLDMEETASHEINHAITAQEEGITVTAISVIREGNTLGYTSFGGYISPDRLMVTSLAGSVHTHVGAPSGDGNDQLQAMYLSQYTDLSISEARARAASHVNKVSPEVRRVASKIIAHLGKVNGSLIPVILRRAELEVRMKKDKKNTYILGRKQVSEHIKVQDAHPIERTTVVELLVGDERRIKYMTGEHVDKEIIQCTLCLGLNGHTPECPSLKKNKDAPKLPNSGSIFNSDELALAA